ncbi:MAG: DUF1287 domain-containing protein [Pseudomonadota bacterium]
MRLILLLCFAIALNLNSDQRSFARSQAQHYFSFQQSFGEKLAKAALDRTNYFVIYNPAYINIGYPQGDVPSYYGVCSDVVIRAYRALGVDLQQLIFRAKLGERDWNIDHRRVRVMRKFFSRYGKSLPVSKNPKNYKPGDIVTYRLPRGYASPTHIAIVSSRKSFLTGRPLIVHNIAFGPQLEDALFDFKITGHYRYKPG